MTGRRGVHPGDAGLWGGSEGKRDKGIGDPRRLGPSQKADNAAPEPAGEGCANLTHLLRELTDEVLSKLLQLIPLQPRQGLGDWGPQADCRRLKGQREKQNELSKGSRRPGLETERQSGGGLAGHAQLGGRRDPFALEAGAATAASAACQPCGWDPVATAFESFLQRLRGGEGMVVAVPGA